MAIKLTDLAKLPKTTHFMFLLLVCMCIIVQTIVYKMTDLADRSDNVNPLLRRQDWHQIRNSNQSRNGSSKGIAREMVERESLFDDKNSVAQFKSNTVPVQVPSLQRRMRNETQTAERLTSDSAIRPQAQTGRKRPRCAINMYGLPRSFRELVLPSLIKNVILTNAQHNCDYFVHYYNVTAEAQGRTNNGGAIHPGHVHDLRDHVLSAIEHSSQQPTIQFLGCTDEEFWNVRNGTIQKVRHTKDKNGNLYYFPWKEESYVFPTTGDNIIKMWHSIQEVWKLMKKNERVQGISYERVAMLRLDLVYMTPINIYNKVNGDRDEQNNVAVIPGFARYPINDRFIYGPMEAVKVWAAERFDRMEDHANRTFYEDEGYGLHSERFVLRAVLPAIREKRFKVEEDPKMCMFRTRADSTVSYLDCGREHQEVKLLGGEVKTVLEGILERRCEKVPRKPSFRCSQSSSLESKTSRRN